MSRITLYSVAEQMGITKRSTIARAGNFVVKMAEEQGKRRLATLVEQEEIHNKKKRVFKVLSWPQMMRPTITQALSMAAHMEANQSK